MKVLTPLDGYSRLPFQYVDDFGEEFYIELNDYIGHAGSLKQRIKPGLSRIGRNVHPRHVQVRSIEVINGKRHYKDIPVLKTNALWTGNLGQKIIIFGSEFETIKKIDEREYGRKGATEARRAIKKREERKAR